MYQLARMRPMIQHQAEGDECQQETNQCQRFELLETHESYVISLMDTIFQNPPKSTLRDFVHKQVQLRMASLTTMEPILELLREMVGTATATMEPGNLRIG